MKHMISHLAKSLLLLALVLTSCSSDPLRDEVREARSYLWTDVQKTDSILSSLDTIGWTNDERLYWEVASASAKLRVNRTLPDDYPYDSLIKLCERAQFHDLIGELYYLKGTMNLLEIDSATIWLKEAEEHLLRADSKEQLAMVYVRLADLYSAEYLFHLSYEYSAKANKLVSPISRVVKYASFLEMYQRYEYVGTPLDSMHYVLRDSVLYYARLLEAPDLESELYLVQGFLEDDDQLVYDAAKYMCDSCGYTLEACFVAQYYMNMHQLKEAERYMQIFASSFDDTGFDFADWNTRKYHYLQSRYLYETGHPKEAFEMMRALNDSIDEVIDRTARVRTYAISRAYDVEKEKAANLQLTNQRQHLYLMVFVIASVLIVSLLILSFAIYYQRLQHRQRAEQMRMEHQRKEEQLRMRHEAEKAELQHQIDIKNASLQAKCEMLTHELKKKLALVREAQIVKMKKSETITEGLMQILFDDKQIEMIVDEYDEATESYLNRLAAAYPQLTKADLRLITFDLLGLSNEDICIILGQEPQSIWNRRNLVREHLGVDRRKYESWLQSDLQAYLMRVLAHRLVSHTAEAIDMSGDK